MAVAVGSDGTPMVAVAERPWRPGARALLAAASGVLLAASFPACDLEPLADGEEVPGVVDADTHSAKRLAAEMRNGVAWAQRRGEPPLDLCHDEIERIGPERVVDELIVVEGERENADVARLTLACGERKLQMVEKPAAAADVGRWSSALDVWPAG